MKTLNPAKRTTTNRKRLFERVEGLKGRVDRSLGIIRDVKILGKHSKNGRTYSDKALNDAARLYEGVKVNVDHPQRDKPNAERGFMEGFGELRNVRRKGDGVFGDLHFLKSHPSAEAICEAAERFPNQFGLSHNADGETHYEGSQLIVESIEIVHSVDIVGRPATNNGLFESTGRGLAMPRVKLGTWLGFLGFGPELRRLQEGGSMHTRRDAEGDPTGLEYRQDVVGTSGKVIDAEGQAEALAATSDALGIGVPIVDADANGIPDDQEEGNRDTGELKAAFRAAVASIFDDDSLTTKEMLEKIKGVLKLQDKLLAAVGGSGGEADPADEGKPFTESIKSPDRRPSPWQARLDEAQRRRRAAAKKRLALQESQRQSSGGSSRPGSFPSDTKSFAAALKAGSCSR